MKIKESKERRCMRKKKDFKICNKRIISMYFDKDNNREEKIINLLNFIIY